ncbi:hypothetical protein MWN41_08535 [Ornithobacterium rhinotracheale]|uniref:hypothetical protein n=1 Tax=Ornithobacterium rhinotracheale TaxID=28251 RepID=UPI00129C2403|nr:hypothetical protein [Ornithobacterium rhinotracheale]MCK0203058.1 hypothetical protein [Ornithobacterium rhinotracheale]MRI64713.1 hypothetical protein [Ornithobacterium rhinotracheale]MRJ09387.1 hypothetical protein [Ornithobacterium rhinotracheale]UOH77335.1 hypothetical protein MT996_08955 [Ornithobacterium rhinotracheale]UOH78739.1 hypothetical protein MT996_04520 [Ornithobacterium rhinotracheale]
MEKFAILHETEEHGQILITRMSESDENYLKVTFLLKGAIVEMKITIKTEKSLAEIFNSYENAETAIHTVSNIKKECKLWD